MQRLRKVLLINFVMVCVLSLQVAALELKPLRQPISLFHDLLNLKSTEASFVAVSFRTAVNTDCASTTKQEDYFNDVGVVMAEKVFEDFCQKIHDDDQVSSPSIPSVIHLIWLGSTPPETVTIAVASWKKHHPTWKVMLWTDLEVEQLVWSNPHSELFFKQAKNYAEKSDILRFEILYQFGGIYSDTDVICLKSFAVLTKNLEFFAGLEDNEIRCLGRPLIGSAVIGAAPGSSIIKRCLELSYTEQEAPNVPQHLRSGPGPITKASYEALESGHKNILILPCSYLYPLAWRRRLVSVQEIKDSIKLESFAIHLWEGSWF